MIELTVGRALRLSAERWPEAPALSCQGRVLSHGEVLSLGHRLANGLLALGFRKGDRIGVMLPNGAAWVGVAYAAAVSGLVLVAVNYRFRAPEVAYQLADAGAAGLIYDAAFRSVVDEVRALMPGLRTVVAGRRDPADVGCFQELEQAPDRAPAVDVREENLFYLGYTSGTTGRPKGAMVTHRNRCLAYHYWALEYGIDAADVALHAGPFHHTAPLGFTLTQLWMGGSVVILPAFDAVAALDAMAEGGVTWSFMVPYMYNALLAVPAAERERCDVGRLRFFISAASALPTRTKEGLLAAWPHVGLHEFYGATEAGVVTNLRPQDQRRKVRCVGKAIFDTEVKVVDEAGAEVAPGTVGELYMRGATLFSGYYNAPERTAAAFRGDWCTLGDLATRDDEGYVYIVDRVKDVIKSGGVNLFPTEIEEALLAHPAVYEAAVVGVPDERWGEAARAVVVRRPEVTVTAAELLGHCRGMLADYKVPKSVEFRAELPRNAAGKVLKRVLRDEFWQGREIKV